MTVTFEHTTYSLEEIIYRAKQRNYDTSIDWLTAFYEFILDWTDPSKDAIFATTSGSTGTPAVLSLSKKAMIASARRTIHYFNINPGGNMLLCMHCKHIGAKMMVVRALENGNPLIIASPQDFPGAWLFDYPIEFAAMVPLQFQYLLDKYPQYLSHFNKIILGGTGLTNKLVNKINKLLPLHVSLFETYGMTETMSHIAAKKYNEPYFTCLEGVEIATDENGCLVISDHHTGVMHLATRDIAELLKSGHTAKQFKLCGRADYVINSGGIKVNPEKIEAILQDSFTSNILIAGLPDEVLGNKLVLLVEGEKQTIDPLIFDVLQKYERPKAIFFIQTFVYTETKKINRQASIDLLLHSNGIDAE